MNPPLSAVYAPAILAQAGRLLSCLDRELPSRSAGNCDREHWSWKFRDFPVGVLQNAVYPMALLWRRSFPGGGYRQNPRLLEWISTVLEQTLGRQRPSGAFDSFAPNEEDAGSTLFIAHGMIQAVRVLEDALGDSMRARCLDGIRRACDFAAARDETHAYLSNHQALFAGAFLEAGDLTGEQQYRRRGHDIIGRILERQSADGWYQEYEGADPGYESLGIFHLAMYWQRTGDARLLESLRRSVEFYAHCVHPDGSVGGVYGSRHTSLYFPGGFEILAGEIPMAAAVARFMRGRLERGNVVTPATADMENLIPLAYSYLEACCGADPTGPIPPLPCESLRGVRRFPNSGLTMAGADNYYAVVHARKGGVCRVFDKQKETIGYEDAGYVLRSGKKRYASQLIGLSSAVPGVGDAEVRCQAQFAEVRQEQLTPGRFLLLRLLNLTLFRSERLGAWLRRRIIARLILAKHTAPIRLERSVRFENEAVHFQDCIRLEQPIPIDELELPRSFTAIHMGSAKYFHASELETTLQAPVGGMAAELNRRHEARCEFTVRFTSSGEAVSPGPREARA